MRWFSAIIIVLLLGGLISWRLVTKHAEAKNLSDMMKMRAHAPVSVELGSVQVRDITNSFEATGSVISPHDVKITPLVTGLLLDVKVLEGDRIHVGEPLANN